MDDRSTNTLLIFTTPNSMLIDKVSREISHYTIDMISAVHHRGVSIGKLSEIKHMNSINKTLFPFIQKQGVKYSRCLFKRIPDELKDAYEERRKRVAAEIAEEKALIVCSMMQQARASLRGCLKIQINSTIG